MSLVYGDGTISRGHRTDRRDCRVRNGAKESYWIVQFGQKHDSIQFPIQHSIAAPTRILVCNKRLRLTK
jgi:hypothetical protein